MGLLTIIKKQKMKDKEIRVLTLGLDNSGKTTIIRKMLGEDVEEVSPTMGFQINSITYKDYTLNVWDIGGQTSLRNFWSNYFDKTNVVIWVVDSASLERLDEAYQELKAKVILQDQLVGIYLLIVINKIDLLDKNQLQLVKDQVVQELCLYEQIPQLDKWNVELVSGRTGDGLDSILEWIVTREY